MNNFVGEQQTILAIGIDENAETNIQTIIEVLRSLQGVRLIPLEEVREELKDSLKSS